MKIHTEASPTVFSIAKAVSIYHPGQAPKIYRQVSHEKEQNGYFSPNNMLRVQIKLGFIARRKLSYENYHTVSTTKNDAARPV